MKDEWQTIRDELELLYGWGWSERDQGNPKDFNLIHLQEAIRIIEACIRSLLKKQEDFFKEAGKQGGNTTKQRHPNHLKEISRKGVEARRIKKLA